MGALLSLLLAASPSVAVLDVRIGAGVDPALGPYLAQVLAQEVEARTRTAPLVSADVTAMLGFERNKRMLGCSEEDSQCLAEITGALGVQQVLATSLAVAGGKYLVSLSLIDARRARPLKRFTETTALDNDGAARMASVAAPRHVRFGTSSRFSRRALATTTPADADSRLSGTATAPRGTRSFHRPG
jgi:hypothetical protein